MTTEADLRMLGDALERAARRDLQPRRRVLLATAGVAALLAIGVGAAIAAGVFSNDQVARALPAGSVLFGGTHPTCALQDDGVTYACNLAALPTKEYIPDHRGAKEPITIDKHIAGGCIGLDREGRRWNCYLGEEAVKHQIVDEGMLGQYSPVPTHG
jgi:hypothetical protein